MLVAIISCVTICFPEYWKTNNIALSCEQIFKVAPVVCFGTDYIMDSQLFSSGIYQCLNNIDLLSAEEVESDEEYLDLCTVVDPFLLDNSKNLDEKPLVIDDLAQPWRWSWFRSSCCVVNVSSEIEQVARGKIGLGDEVILDPVVVDVLVNRLE